MADRITIGTVAVDPGEKTRGYVDVLHRTDGRTVQLPLLIVNGARTGPTVWLSGCHHGDELGGPLAIFRVFDAIEPENLAGKIVGVPVSNPSAVWGKQRNSPVDGKDLERAFPGDFDGSYTDRLAAAIHTLVMDHADYLVDLHGGLKDHKIIHQAYFNYFTPDIKNRNRELAEVMACDYVCGLSDREFWGGTGLQCVLASEGGIPAVLSETNDAQSHYDDIMNILVHLQMIEGQVEKRTQIFQKTLHLVLARHSGLFVPTVDLYDRIEKEDVIARIVTLVGDVVEEIRSPVDNGLVTVMRRIPIVEAVWEGRVLGPTFEAAGVFEIGEVADW